jgi:hypothetical protein
VSFGVRIEKKEIPNGQGFRILQVDVRATVSDKAGTNLLLRREAIHFSEKILMDLEVQAVGVDALPRLVDTEADRAEDIGHVSKNGGLHDAPLIGLLLLCGEKPRLDLGSCHIRREPVLICLRPLFLVRLVLRQNGDTVLLVHLPVSFLTHGVAVQDGATTAPLQRRPHRATRCTGRVRDGCEPAVSAVHLVLLPVGTLTVNIAVELRAARAHAMIRARPLAEATVLLHRRTFSLYQKEQRLLTSSASRQFHLFSALYPRTAR